MTSLILSLKIYMSRDTMLSMPTVNLLNMVLMAHHVQVPPLRVALDQYSDAEAITPPPPVSKIDA
jgi:hypothetical protein